MSKALGRGLGALLDDATVTSIQQGRAERYLPIASLMPSSVQPRKIMDDDALKSLSNSIKAQGVIQPLLVRPGASGKYEIIAGERRWRASQLAGLKEVPVVIRELDDGKALEVAIVENVQRADLNPIDEASGYLRLVNEFNYTHEDMARVTGKSRSHITNMLRLLSLPDVIKDRVSNNLLTMGHARAIIGLSDDPELQFKLAEKVVRNGLSVRDIEDMVRRLNEGRKAGKSRKNPRNDTQEMEQKIANHLGLKVALRLKDDVGGTLRIFFDSTDQMKGFLTRMGMKAS